MSMNGYLSAIKGKIKGLPDSYSKEILQDYENHFAEGLLVGKTEKDITSELGDADTIAKNIIAEYYIEHSEDVNSAKNVFKAIATIANAGIGAINLLIVIPLSVAAALFILSLYILDYTLLLLPIVLALKLMLPVLPISFGTEVLWVNVTFALVGSAIGYYYLRALKRISAKFFSWTFKYIIKSFKFQVLSKG